MEKLTYVNKYKTHNETFLHGLHNKRHASSVYAKIMTSPTKLPIIRMSFLIRFIQWNKFVIPVLISVSIFYIYYALIKQCICP